ncbi:PHD finger protein 20-like protein 1 [Oopsacas minuta]|uniref:PHD finger protein 20-like protein 1 n=1 Tax=Oopsacas minuta TaxID=111878 RepID=A0AAV7JTE2_9METZ|nr:PHD finger protein 20-like protein 1 [Oopsacas minuta]
MDNTKSLSGKGKNKKVDTDDKDAKTKAKEFVEGSGLSRSEIQVGYKLMAASFDCKWYQGRIVEVDESDSTFLVHFDFWNSRFDEWYKFTTKKVKPLQEEPYSRKKIIPKFKLGDPVTAKWIDGKQYRGKIDEVKPNDCYDVLFEDGVIYSTDISTLKLGDRRDASLEEERLLKRDEVIKRSREREFRSQRRSLEPGSIFPSLSLQLDDIKPSFTAVKHTTKLNPSLSLGLSYPLKKVSLSFDFELNKNVCVSRGRTYNVPSPTNVLGTVKHTVTTATKRALSPEFETPENSPRKRGRPKIHSPTSTIPIKHTDDTDILPKSISPNKKTISKKVLHKHIILSSISPTPKSPVNKTPTKCTVSVQTDPIEELKDIRPIANPLLAPTALRPHYPVPPVPPQPAPPLLQTETVLTSDGRWITIATPQMAAQQPLQISSDVTQRQPPTAPNTYYQLVPMGANGPIHPSPVAPLPPPSQPQDPLSHLVLAQPTHNPVMMLPPQPRPILQNSSPYIQSRPILQYQATSSAMLQPQNPSTVLMHTNPLHQQIILPQQPVVNNSTQLTTHQDNAAAPQIAQRQTDPPSAMNLSANSPVPVSPLPYTSPTDPVPPVSSNLVASRATIRLPDVQATAPVMTTPQVLTEKRENGENFSPTSLISLSSRLPFSSLLSNTIQPSQSLPITSYVTAVSEHSGEVTTIFASSCSTPKVTSTAEITTPTGPIPDPAVPTTPSIIPIQTPTPLDTNTLLKSQLQQANEDNTDLIGSS